LTEKEIVNMITHVEPDDDDDYDGNYYIESESITFKECNDSINTIMSFLEHNSLLDIRKIN
jgi:hypothetical protein